MMERKCPFCDRATWMPDGVCPSCRSMETPSGLFAGNPPKSDPAHNDPPGYRCDFCGTTGGTVRNHMPGKKFACNQCFGDRYRRAAESAGRDGIKVDCRERDTCNKTMTAKAGKWPCFLTVGVNLDDNPENWHDQAIQLVNRVHRLRELMRQAGEAI